MSGSIPCLGYPSRTSAVAALLAEGIPRADIAKRIGITVQKVHCLAHYAKSERRRESTAAEVRGRPAGLMADLIGNERNINKLAREHAAKRGWTTERLAREIMNKVIGDDIVDAVLDDADEIRRVS